MFNDGVVAVQQRDARAEIGHNGVTIPEKAEVTGQIRAADEFDVLAVQCEALNALIAAIRHQERRTLAACIQHDAVRTIHLTRRASLPAEGPNELSLVIILIDEAGPVAVADIDIAIRRDRQIRGTVLRLLAVRRGFVGGRVIGVADAPDLFAIQRRLHYHAAAGVAEIEELRRAFLLYMQPVRAALEFPAPALDELAFAIEDHHRIRALAGCEDRVVDINPALRILYHTVRIAVQDVGGHLTPIVISLVNMVAGPEHRTSCAGFIVGIQDDGRKSGGLQEGASSGRHGVSPSVAVYRLDCNQTAHTALFCPLFHTVRLCRLAKLGA